jgi:HAD superfamily 5'-nucleotidase-like hydrolase
MQRGRSMIDKVFINRTLNMKRIKYVGFDMDHTLVRYHTEAFERLAHEIMKVKLVARGYPEAVLNLPFEFERSIRGLVVDKVRGNILKVSRHGAIRASKHGTRPIDYATQQKIYTGTYIDLGSSDYSSIDTSFATSVAILYAQLVDLKNDLSWQNLPDFKRMFEDVVYVMDESHRDGSLKTEVAKNLDKYIIKDAKTVEGLERYIKHDKKLFVLTNSDFHYTKLLLDYAINPF